MNKRSISLLVLYFLIFLPGYSQEKSKKELKEEKRLERQQEVDSLVNSRVFSFEAITAMPQGGRSVNLATNPNFIRFNPELMEGRMPFFGRSYSGTSYGGDGGIEFSAQPDQFEVEKKKDNWLVSVVVKGGNDVFRLNLNITPSGSSSLTITSNNRSTISYNGEIGVTEKKQ